MTIEHLKLRTAADLSSEPIKMPTGLAQKLMERVSNNDYYLKVKIKPYTEDEEKCRAAMIEW